jgi:hypothetical protein
MASMLFWTPGSPFPYKKAPLTGVAKADKKPNFIEFYKGQRREIRDKQTSTITSPA